MDACSHSARCWSSYSRTAFHVRMALREDGWLPDLDPLQVPTISAAEVAAGPLAAPRGSRGTVCDRTAGPLGLFHADD